MENKSWIFTLAVVLALGGGGYGACAAVTDGGVGEALTAEVPTDPSIVIPGQDDPLYLPDAGAGLAVEVPEFEVDVPLGPEVEFEEELTMDVPEDGVDMPADPQDDYDYADVASRTCGMEVCDEGERCCQPTGGCYPIDCQDCCHAMVDPPGADPVLVPDEPGPVR